MINVFIPHRWNNNDYSEISALLDRTKFSVRDYSVPSSSPFDNVDRRYNVDPKIQKQIKYASLYICGFPAFVLSNGSSLALFVGRVIDANVIIQKNEKEKMI